VLFNTI